MIAKILLRALLETACKLGGREQHSLSGRATLIEGGRTTGNGERERNWKRMGEGVKRGTAGKGVREKAKKW